MTDNKMDLCARAYLEYYRSQFKKYAWAYDYAEKLMQTNPKGGLEFVVELLNMCQGEKEVAYVAAGPLEDLLHRHLPLIKKDVEIHIHSNKLMRAAIRYVWASDKSPVNVFLSDMLSRFGESRETSISLERHDPRVREE